MVSEKLGDEAALCRQGETVCVEMDVDDMKSAVRSAGCKQNRIASEVVSRHDGGAGHSGRRSLVFRPEKFFQGVYTV